MSVVCLYFSVPRREKNAASSNSPEPVLITYTSPFSFSLIPTASRVFGDLLNFAVSSFSCLYWTEIGKGQPRKLRRILFLLSILYRKDDGVESDSGSRIPVGLAGNWQTGRESPVSSSSSSSFLYHLHCTYCTPSTVHTPFSRPCSSIVSLLPSIHLLLLYTSS